jgi:hypothetical protein
MEAARPGVRGCLSCTQCARGTLALDPFHSDATLSRKEEEDEEEEAEASREDFFVVLLP